jgi:hypothetical protein
MTGGPHFLVPYVDDSAKAERIWQGIKTLMSDGHGWPRVTEHRIFRLEYGHNDGRETAQVGEPHRHGHPKSWDYDQTQESTKAREVSSQSSRTTAAPTSYAHTTAASYEVGQSLSESTNAWSLPISMDTTPPANELPDEIAHNGEAPAKQGEAPVPLSRPRRSAPVRGGWAVVRHRRCNPTVIKV